MKVPGSVKVVAHHYGDRVVRVVEVDGVSRVVARDVIDVVGLVNTTDATRAVPASEKRSVAVPGIRGRPVLLTAVGLAAVLSYRRTKAVEDFCEWAASGLLDLVRCSATDEEMAEAAASILSASPGHWPGTLLHYAIGPEEDGCSAVIIRDEEGGHRATAQQISVVAGTSVRNVREHISSIYEEGLLDYLETRRSWFLVSKESGRDARREVFLYDMRVLNAVLDRVNTVRGAAFRVWRSELVEAEMRRQSEASEARALSAIEEVDRLRVEVSGSRRALDEARGLRTEAMGIRDRLVHDLAELDLFRDLSRRSAIDASMRLRPKLAADWFPGSGWTRDDFDSTVSWIKAVKAHDARESMVRDVLAYEDLGCTLFPRTLAGPLAFDHAEGDGLFRQLTFCGAPLPLIEIDPASDLASKVGDRVLLEIATARLASGVSVVVRMHGLDAARTAGWEAFASLSGPSGSISASPAPKPANVVAMPGGAVQPEAPRSSMPEWTSAGAPSATWSAAERGRVHLDRRSVEEVDATIARVLDEGRLLSPGRIVAPEPDAIGYRAREVRAAALDAYPAGREPPSELLPPPSAAERAAHRASLEAAVRLEALKGGTPSPIPPDPSDTDPPMPPSPPSTSGRDGGRR